MPAPTRILCLAAGLALLGATGAGAATYSALVTLSGAQEVPPSGSTATGAANVCIDTDANTLTYNITHTVAGENGAHFHGFAAPGFNAGIKHPLALGAQKKGTWTYVEADEAGILGGLVYVNVHSGAFPGGEIRAQIAPIVDGCTSNPLPAVSGPALVAASAVILLVGGVVILRRRVARG